MATPNSGGALRIAFSLPVGGAADLSQHLVAKDSKGEPIVEFPMPGAADRATPTAAPPWPSSAPSWGLR